mgnify:CR=1 FL=1
MVKADGTKFGKTESGTVWLDPDLTSPYAFHQFWLNADDRDVPMLLRTFSFRSRQDVEALVAATSERPHERAGQRALADELTDLVHGAGERSAAEAAGRALFGQGDLADLPEATLRAALAETPHGVVAPAEVVDGQLPTVEDLLVRAGLAASKGQARRTIAEGGAYVNNYRVEAEGERPRVDDLLHGSILVLRRGKRTVGGIRVE